MRLAVKGLKGVAASFVVIFLLSCFAFLMTKPVQAAVKEVIVTWFEEHTEFDFVGEMDKIRNVNWEPQYIPDGFRLLAQHYGYGNDVYSEYVNDDDERYLDINILKAATGNHLMIDNEHTEYSTVTINGTTADLYSAVGQADTSYLIWIHSEYVFFLQTNLPPEELINVTESISSYVKVPSFLT